MQFTLGTLGDVLLDTEQYAEALRHFENALGISQALGDERAVARALANLGRVHAATGDMEAAADRWRRALVIFEELGDTQADDVRHQLAAHGLAEP
jgi:tetratricopeptide (TPR) repeat protein